MIGAEDLNSAHDRVAERLIAMSPFPEFHADRVVVGGRGAAHGFAGTDLPGPLLLQALDSIITEDPPSDLPSLRGLVLDAFFFGWEVRNAQEEAEKRRRDRRIAELERELGI